MLNALKESLWRQFGASIDMLGNAIARVPEDRWAVDRKFFYMAYHCLIFLDYYLTIPARPFVSPLPFTLVAPEDIPEGALDDLVPDRIYTKPELLGYLQASREKCRVLIMVLTEESVGELWREFDGDREYPVLELLLYNMRHVQHHAAQLNLLLRQTIGDAPDWVSRAK